MLALNPKPSDAAHKSPPIGPISQIGTTQKKGG